MTSVDEATFVIKPTEDTVGEYPDTGINLVLSLSETVAEKAYPSQFSLEIMFH
ncbi:MAG: hypothetical protein ACLS9T_10485 [Streptococcus salivarius]